MFFKGCVSGEDDGEGELLEWGGGRLGDQLSEWERRRPDTRERKRNRIHAVPPPPRLSGEEGKWGTKDAHGPRLGSLDEQGHLETPPQQSPATPDPAPAPSPERLGKRPRHHSGARVARLGPVPN